jgi:HPt (histidine-containing phosphotransfer) domain-containing protein
VSFEDLLKSLRQDYLAALPAKIVSIREQIAAVDIAGIRESFHKLKGTGRTYGLPEVSEVAEIIEGLCAAKHASATAAATHALQVLEDIHSARNAGREFVLDQHPAYQGIRKLLQN